MRGWGPRIAWLPISLALIGLARWIPEGPAGEAEGWLRFLTGGAASTLLISALCWCLLLAPALGWVWARGSGLLWGLLGWLPLLIPATRDAPASGALTLRIGVGNLQAYSDPDPALEEALLTADADAWILIERRLDLLSGYDLVTSNFGDPDLPASRGMAGLCREETACFGAVSPLIGGEEDACRMPWMALRMELGGGQGLCLLGLHHPPPLRHCVQARAAYLAEVLPQIHQGYASTQGVCERGDPLVVLGDLNAAPGSAAHQDLIQRGLRDSLHPLWPWPATWPAGGGFPVLPLLRLDHVLLGEGVALESLKPLSLPGSDHRGWLAEISLDRPAP